MASQAKKNKARNSYIYNGGEKPDDLKLKRTQYYVKQNRLHAKKATQRAYKEVQSEVLS